jgi:hypothetical protein
MILGGDDTIKTTTGNLLVPRDNVVFELGLFMAHLGVKRTFMVVPSLGMEVKLLSDLAGMIWAKYAPPADMADAIEKIVAAIERDSRRNVLAYDGPPSVHDFKITLLDEANRRWQKGEHVTVWNFALDMSATWAPMYESLENSRVRNLTWRSLVLDPDWVGFQNFESETIRISRARDNLNSIQEYCAKHKDRLEQRNVVFECRAYSSVPFVHGFLLNGSFLIFTLLRRDEEGRLSSLDNAYLRFPRYNEISAHSIESYTDWFKYEWANSRHIWPL